MSTEKPDKNTQQPEQTPDHRAPPDQGSTEKPQIFTVAQLNQPFSRRGLMRGVASAASALAVGSLSGTAEAKRRNEATGKAHVQVDLRAFSNGIRSIHALGDEVHIAAVSSKGELRVWPLERPSEPLDIGLVQSVRSVASGAQDELAWLSGTMIHYRRLAAPRKDIWSRKEKGVEALLTVAPDALLFSNADRELMRLSLASGERVGRPWPLPLQASSLEQLVVARDGTVWSVAAGQVHRRRPNAPDWEHVFRSEPSTIVRLDALAEQMVVERNGFVQLLRLPSLEAIGVPTALPAEVDELLVIGGFSTLKRYQANPTFDPLLKSRAELARDGRSVTVIPLDGSAGPRRYDLGPGEARVLSGFSPSRGYAWGDSDGRMGVVGGKEVPRSSVGRGTHSDTIDELLKGSPGASRGGAKRRGPSGGGGSSGGGGVPFAAPGASVSTKGGGVAAEGGWAGNACACNTVEVKAGESGRSYSTWDNVSHLWVHRTIGISEKLPEGAICTCNTVGLGQGEFFREICTCNQVCTCNPMCTCESVCTCQMHGYSSHYWRPN